MSESRLPVEWSTRVSNHKLAQVGDIDSEATRNMLVFALSEVEPMALREEQLSRFLLDVFHSFCLKAARARFSGWFYAWFDEMSGTLRCSACSVARAKELPFSSRLHLVDLPHEIAQAAAGSNYISGIPAVEFQQSEEGDEEDGEPEFTLTVFARRMIGPA